MNEPCFYRVSVKGTVIDDQGRLLLVRESDGTWDMLGGGLDHGEHPTECLQREIQEETGLVVTEVSPTPHYFATAYKASSNIHIASVVYRMTCANLDFTPSDECQELRFCSFAEMRALQLAPNLQALLDSVQPLKQIAGCVLEKDGAYLLVQEKRQDVRGLWNVPAGHVDPGEDLQTAAVREVQEETGLTVAIRQKVFAAALPERGREFHMFTADITGGELHIQPEEILDAQWFTLDQIHQMQQAGQLRSDWMVIAIENSRTSKP